MAACFKPGLFWAMVISLVITKPAWAEDPISAGVDWLANDTQCEDIRAERYVYLEYLCAFKSISNTTWFVLGHTGMYTIDGLFDGGTIYDFKISSDKSKLVLVYGEEGHPTLLYYDISNWDLDNGLALIWGRGTYPGSIGHDGWDGDKLIVESDHDLTTPGEPFLGEGLKQFWRYHISPQGKVSRIIQ